mgnify:CR=1 FL=1
MPVYAAYLALLNRKIQHADHVLMRRARFIQRLHLFQGWPLQEIAFFAYYMREYEVKKGEIIYTAGDVARSVYFVLSGAVALETNKVVSKNSGSTIKTVLEHVRAPRWFGEEELLASLYGDSMDAEIVPTPVRVCVCVFAGSGVRCAYRPWLSFPGTTHRWLTSTRQRCVTATRA